MEDITDTAEHVWTPHKSNQRVHTHPPERCAGSPCCVHNPGDHHMRDWPQHYREDTGVTERICGCGVGHPDPDQPWPAGDPRWVHGCCGCCRAEHETPFVGGFLEGSLRTKRKLPDGHVLSVAIQLCSTGNGHRVIQRESYLVCNGVATALGKGGAE